MSTLAFVESVILIEIDFDKLQRNRKNWQGLITYQINKF